MEDPLCRQASKSGICSHPALHVQSDENEMITVEEKKTYIIFSDIFPESFISLSSDTGKGFK